MSNHQSIGYVRVSTAQQTLDQQRDALEAAGVIRVFSDVMSGARTDRPGLAAALDYLREGDTLTVVALDRLGRSMSHVIATIDDLQARGVLLRSLREGVDFSQPMGRMVAGVFSALAEYERSLIAERAAAAREAARARGQQTGRPRVLDASRTAQAVALRAAGVGPSEIARTLQVSRATVYRYLDQSSATPLPL